MQSHALASVSAAADDAVPEADEILLELLAEAVRDHRPPTSKELLDAAKVRDEATFKRWQTGWVTGRLKAYGIPTPRKSNGARRYRDVTPAQLREIGERYGIDLGFGGAESSSTPAHLTCFPWYFKFYPLAPLLEADTPACFGSSFPFLHKATPRLT